MDNRPHSRERKYTNTTQSVEKHSFNDSYSNNSYSRGSYNRSSSSNIILALLALLFSTKNKNGKTSILNIIKVIIIVFVLYKIVTFLFGGLGNMFSFSSDTNVNNNYNDNTTIVDNHNNNNNNDVSNTVLTGTRDKYTKIIGNNEDEVTVMVYMIGTDLESGYGAASKDIQEMYYAGIDDNINIVIETGGCSRWNIQGISNRSLGRYTVNSEGLYALQENIPSEAMTRPEVLADFIQYASSNFPANRYMLILWDHGGGSVTGYGYDENYPYAGSMSPDSIAEALRAGGVKFDVVGFDACLMANLETAIALEPYADYLIGSEETEPGDGWYYTDWIKLLDSNTSIETVKLGKQIIDDYIAHSNKSAELTESITDLGELKYAIAKPLATFSKSLADKLNSNEYQIIANARSKTKEFSKSNKLDQVDLIDLAQRMDVEGSDALINAIKTSVKYSRTANISNSYGLSAYFPYASLSKMNQMVEIYDNIGMDEEYSNALKSFATYASSGQIVTQNSYSSNTSIFDVLMGNDYTGYQYDSNDIYSLLFNALGGGYGSNYDYYGYGNEYGYDSFSNIFGGGSSSWVDSSLLGGIANYLGSNRTVNTNSLKIYNKNGQNVVTMSEEEWSLIDNVLLHMFVDDGEGYIDLGMDNIFDFNDDGDLIVDHNGSWLVLNGHFVPYYFISDDGYTTKGRIPAKLNGERVDIMVEFTDGQGGKVLGAKKLYEDSDTLQKGLIELVPGDKIQFVCNYYSYDGEYIDEYQLGDTLKVTSNLTLADTFVGNDYVYTYCFIDIYGNNLWTPKRQG